ncbi:MAG: HDOD domain-containing protein [Bryobacteraceae bacterium]
MKIRAHESLLVLIFGLRKPICNTMDVYVARQAILDRKGDVFAYELLFRSSAASREFGGADASAATNQVVANALLNFSDSHLLGGKKAFLNFNRELLLDGLPLMLPKQTAVIEILEAVDPDADVVEACREMHEMGYSLALDDFLDRDGMGSLIHLANFIKVDLRSTSREEQKRIVDAYRPKGVAMLAEKVESHEEFEWAAGIGFDYFQGYYFEKPVTLVGRQVPVSKIAGLRLLRELQSPELDFHRIEQTVSADLGFSHKLLRYVNSAAFGRREPVASIRTALAVLGEENIRRWVALAALPALAADKPGALVTQSILRARFWELLAIAAGVRNPERLFLMGMFSLLDALIDRPLEDSLREVGVAPPIIAVLVDKAPESDPFARVRRLAIDYERGEWDGAATLGEALGITANDVVEAYTSALKWADEIVASTK